MLKKRILVVEDEGIIARDLSAMLEQMGHSVTGQAGTYAEAMELASILPPHLVLMDIKIRGPLDGVATAEEIRKRLGLPVVFVTAHADAHTLQRANVSQPFGYVVKPFNESALRVAIEVALNRHKLQEQADSKQTWLRYALEGISEAVLATDADGYVTLMNPGAEQLTGWTRNEAIGQHIWDVLDLRYGDERLDLLEMGRNSTHEEPLSFPNASVRGRDGKECTVVGSFGPVQRLGSRVQHGYVALVRPTVHTFPNTTDASSDRQLQELSYALSNDLREPVRNVSCFAKLLERSGLLNLDDSSREYLKFIVEGSKRIESQMSALRSFHLAGIMQSRDGLIADATEICHQVLDSFAERIIEVGAEIELGPLPAVAMDPNTLRDLVERLLTNALQFRADRPPRIHISAVRTGELWRFRFRDNGLGFESNQSERIFGLFTRAHNTPPSGNGIGLAICRRAIKTAGGRIWAESEEGAGADFFLTLPALNKGAQKS